MRTVPALLAVVVSASVVHAEPPAAPTDNPAPAAPSEGHIDPFAVSGIHDSPSAVHVDPFATSGIRADRERVVHEDPGAGRRTAVKALAFGGLGVIAAGFAMSVYERSDYDHAVRAGNIDRANFDYSVVKYAGTGMFVTGVAALGAALVLRATLPEKHTIISPAVAPGQVGLVVARGF